MGIFLKASTIEHNEFDFLFRSCLCFAGVIRTIATLDRETTPAYWLTVFVQDCGLVPLSSYVDVYITVTDANDNVPVTSDPIYFATVAENSPSDVEVVKIVATDKDSGRGSDLTFEITAGNPQQFFKIDPETGELKRTFASFEFFLV